MGSTGKDLQVLEGRFSLVPRNLSEAMEFAKLISTSGVVPSEYAGKPGDILVAVQMGMEVGLKPLQALQSIACINGRPTIWGDAALALVKQSGKLELIEERSSDEALKSKEGKCTVKRIGETNKVTRSFSIEDAQKAGLQGRGGPHAPWQTYPGRMLQMRARSWALRDVFPDVLKGLSVREEVEDFQQIGETEEGHQIQIPRRTGEPAPVDPEQVDAFIAESQPVSKQTSEAKQADPAKTKGGNWEGMLSKIEEKSGTTNNKKWKVWSIEATDGTRFGTFDETDAGVASSAIQQGVALRINYEETARGKRVQYIEPLISANAVAQGPDGEIFES